MIPAPLARLRRLSLGALLVGYLHIVFGAFVRISGSGFGCGDHWPRCQGLWFPPLDRTDLIIELAHRYLAATLILAIGALLFSAWTLRRADGVSGPGGILRPAVLATVLVVTAAVFGAVIVKLDLQNRYVVVVHLAIAMAILATLVVAAIRAGAFGRETADAGGASPRTARSARALAGIVLAVLIVGALTANLPGASLSCTGFPLCRNGYGSEHPYQVVQLSHRLLAFLVLFHAIGVMMGVRKRGESPQMRRWSMALLHTILLQIILAAGMVEMSLPLWSRSAHQALATALWIISVIFATLAARAAGTAGATVGARVPLRPMAGAAESTS